MSRLDDLRALRAMGRLVLKAQPAARGAGAGGTVAGEADEPGTGRAGAAAGRSDARAARDEACSPARVGAAAPGSFVPVETEAGTAWCRRTVYPAGFRHGRGDPASWLADLSRSLDLLAAVAGPAGRRQPVPPAPEQLLFLDLETTGLAVAAGHRPFLAGLAWFGPPPAGAAGDFPAAAGPAAGEPHVPSASPAGDRPSAGVVAGAVAGDDPVGRYQDARGQLALYVEQLLVPDLEPGTEQAWLAALARRVEERPWLVTFNGRGFDWPMLETRWQWHRQAVPPLRAHFDLLYPARRLWARPGCRVNLRALEHRLLGFHRVGDVAGAEVPSCYARFLQAASGGPGPALPAGGVPAAGLPAAKVPAGPALEPAPEGRWAASQEPDALAILAPVLRHNRLDLLSLAGIASWVGGWLAGGPDRVDRWDDALAGAREWERVDATAAVAWYERALVLASGRGAVAAVARRLVPLYRRQRRWAEAVALEAALCDAYHPLAPIEPWLDLAELWLHLRDRPRAARYLGQAQRLWERRQRLGRAGADRTRPVPPGGPVGRRMERLQQRLAGTGERQARAL